MEVELQDKFKCYYRHKIKVLWKQRRKAILPSGLRKAKEH